MKQKSNSQHSLILVAAGKGERFGKIDKLLFPLNGIPTIAYSLKTFLESQLFSEIIVVYRDPAQHADLEKALHSLHTTIPIQYVKGGSTRQTSVANGLAAVEPTNRYVWIHDGARPFVHPESLIALKTALEEHGAAVLAHRITDTIKRTHPQTGGASLLENIDRSVLWAMETPQCFERELILRAHDMVGDKEITDDTAAVSELGHPVFLVENPHPNPKLTRPADAAYFEFLARTI